jgi:hypothetical protein
MSKIVLQVAHKDISVTSKNLISFCMYNFHLDTELALLSLLLAGKDVTVYCFIARLPQGPKLLPN